MHLVGGERDSPRAGQVGADLREGVDVGDEGLQPREPCNTRGLGELFICTL